MKLRIGTAGWAIGSAAAASFPPAGSGLERYAALFDAAEINSSFHRSHRPSTWQRWHDSVPAHFRFSAKIPKTISHQRKVVDCDELLKQFLDEAGILRDKLGAVLLQLPPKLAFEPREAARFLELLRSSSPAPVVIEPRHPGWFEAQADALLRDLRIARVAADPAVVPDAARPGGWMGFEYRRLHGSPVMYRSSYQDRIGDIAGALTNPSSDAAERWCIFDNTASSAAISDALALASAVNPQDSPATEFCVRLKER